MYTKEYLELSEEIKVQESDMELFAAIIAALNLRLIAVYRQPNHNISDEALTQQDKQLAKQGRNAVVGDLNMDARLSCPTPQLLWNSLLEAGLTQRERFITRPPRRKKPNIDSLSLWFPTGDKVARM